MIESTDLRGDTTPFTKPQHVIAGVLIWKQ